MVKLKTPEEIELLAEGGQRLFTILEELEQMAKPGMTGAELDRHARELTKKMDAKPAFFQYKGFPAGVCVSANNAVVHGLPGDTPFEEGDIVGIDYGLIYKGMYTDSARTVAIGEVSPEKQRLLDVTKHALALGIEAAKPGNTTGDIGHAVQAYVENEGFGVVRQLVGHGVGYGVHEEPSVPNFGAPKSGYPLKKNLVIAIEPMVTIGDPQVKTADDDWTIVTKDGSIAAHFEHTVVITDSGARILTIK